MLYNPAGRLLLISTSWNGIPCIGTGNGGHGAKYFSQLNIEYDTFLLIGIIARIMHQLIMGSAVFVTSMAEALR